MDELSCLGIVHTVALTTEQWMLCKWEWYVLSQALEALNKKDITEIKSYGKPPPLVEKVLEAVMILRGNEPTWAEAKRQLGRLVRRVV